LFPHFYKCVTKKARYQQAKATSTLCSTLYTYHEVIQQRLVALHEVVHTPLEAAVVVLLRQAAAPVRNIHSLSSVAGHRPATGHQHGLKVRVCEGIFIVVNALQQLLFSVLTRLSLLQLPQRVDGGLL
jgi:hypothetical protein